MIFFNVKMKIWIDHFLVLLISFCYLGKLQVYLTPKSCKYKLFSEHNFKSTITFI